MSKPLSDDEKEKVFGDIAKSIAHINQPAPGEFTIEMLKDALSGQGYNVSKSKLRHRLYKLVEAEVIGKREINTHGTRTNVFIPLRDVPYDEILDILLES